MTNQFNHRIFYALGIAALMLCLGACDKNGLKADACSKYNNNPTDCKKATDKANKKCKYDDVTKTCEPEKTATACKDLDEDQCLASLDCHYDATKTPKCQDADAAVKGKCNAIQTQKACEDNNCDWDKSMTPHACKPK